MKTVSRFFLCFALGFSLLNGCKQSTDPVTPSATSPVLGSTTAPTPPTEQAMSLAGTISANGGGAITQHGHAYSETNKTPTVANSKTELGTNAGPFPATFASVLTGLKINTIYYIRAYATNSAGISYGPVLEVRTAEVKVVVDTPTLESQSIADQPTTQGFRVRSTISGNRNGAITQHGHVYSETNRTPTIADPRIELGANAGPFPAPFTSLFTGLKANTLYYVRPYATNEKGTTYAAGVEIRTNPAPTAPVVTDVPTKADVGETNMKVTGKIAANGNAAITEHGFYYSKTNLKPNAGDMQTTLGVNNGPFPAQFTSQLTGLAESTTYYVRSYARNEAGTTFGDNALTVSTNGFGVYSSQLPGYGALGGEAVGDYDGDRRTDIAKHDNNNWLIDYAKDGFGSWNETLGGVYTSANSKAVPADYDGDGKTDIGIHYNNGAWFIYYAKDRWGSTNASFLPGYGSLGGEAVADYDGDGKADIAMQKNDNWLIDYATNGFGFWDLTLKNIKPGGKPFPADYDGDGKADLSIHYNDGGWTIDLAKNGYAEGASWDENLTGYGANTGYEAIGDYDGDKKADIAGFINGRWYIDYAKDGFGKWNKNDMTVTPTNTTGNPVAGDYDGDGITDLGLHTADGRWLIDFWNNQ